MNISKSDNPEIEQLNLAAYESGNVKTAITDLRDVGRIVARILTDIRTINRYVFIWAEEISQNEAVALAEKVLGKKLEVWKAEYEEHNKKKKGKGRAN